MGGGRGLAPPRKIDDVVIPFYAFFCICCPFLGFFGVVFFGFLRFSRPRGRETRKN